MTAKQCRFISSLDKVDQTTWFLRILLQEWFSFSLLLNKIITTIEIEAQLTEQQQRVIYTINMLNNLLQEFPDHPINSPSGKWYRPT